MGNRRGKKAGRKAQLAIVRRDDRGVLRSSFAERDQVLLPLLLELIEDAQSSVDELMTEAARGFVERLSKWNPSRISTTWTRLCVPWLRSTCSTAPLRPTGMRRRDSSCSLAGSITDVLRLAGRRWALPRTHPVRSALEVPGV